MTTYHYLDLDVTETRTVDPTVRAPTSQDGTLSRQAMAKLIDHTNLHPDASPDAIESLCRSANEHRVASICVSPNQLPLPALALREDIAIGTVCGFPSGAHAREIKAAEATVAVESGATEVDVVIDLGLVKAGRWNDIEADIALVRKAVPFVTLKVIIESAALTENQIVQSCKVVAVSGAEFVMTSTGFHASGSASTQAVSLMAETVDGRIGVKASGGIRNLQTAQAMIECGATRIGTSSTTDILSGLAL